MPKDIQINKIKNKLTEEKQNIGEPRRMLTRPGRLRARSGSKLPEANVPLRVLEGWFIREELLQTFEDQPRLPNTPRVLLGLERIRSRLLLGCKAASLADCWVARRILYLGYVFCIREKAGTFAGSA